MPHRARDTILDASLPGLTRQSIRFERILRSGMDTRVKPAYDAEYVATPARRFLNSNFKQPHFCILAAQCVRGLPVSREPREGMERREAPGCSDVAPLEAGLTYPPRAARGPRAPSDVGRGASRRSTLATRSSDSAAFMNCRGIESLTKVLSLRAGIVNPRLLILPVRRFAAEAASSILLLSARAQALCKRFTSTAPTWRISRSAVARRWCAYTARWVIS